MICPHCHYAMDAFDKECPRCHGKGISQQQQPQPASSPTPTLAQTAPSVPSHYSRFCPHCGSRMAASMQICPSCRKSASTPVAAPVNSHKATKFGIAAVLLAVIGVGFSLMRQGKGPDTTSNAPVSPPIVGNSVAAKVVQQETLTIAVLPTNTPQPSARQLQAVKSSSFEDTEKEDEAHAYLLDVKRNLTPVIKLVIIQYHLGSRAKCAEYTSQAAQIATRLRQHYHSLSVPFYMKDAWSSFGSVLGSTAEDLKDLLGELDGTGVRFPGNAVEGLKNFESSMERCADEITLARMKRPR